MSEATIPSKTKLSDIKYRWECEVYDFSRKFREMDATY